MKSINTHKMIVTIILGNILEYYDFLLFAHLGFIITPLFFPNHSSTQTHILSLILFGLSFVIRPIGGYIFGQISDKYGRKTALVQSVKWAIFPSIALALLPTFSSIGITGSIIFVVLRLLQGVALGGEYPVAGIYLMEVRKTNQGLLSSILVASGSVGSILGLLMAMACMQPDAPSWLWRLSFFIGGLGSYMSYFMRSNLGELPPSQDNTTNTRNIGFNRFLVIMIGLLIGATVWLPMTYSNFYVTKILLLPANSGLYASFIALICYIVILPIFGAIYDTTDQKKYIVWSAFLACPISISSLYLLSKGQIALAQIIFIISTASFGAPLYKLIYSLFPREVRGRNLGFLLMVGLSFGGMLPSVASYIVDKTRWDLSPALLVGFIAIITCYCLYRSCYNNKNAPS